MTFDQVFGSLWTEVGARFPAVADYHNAPERLPLFRKTMEFWAAKLRHVTATQAVAALDALHDDPERSTRPADFFTGFLRKLNIAAPRGSSSGLGYVGGVQVSRCKNWCSEGIVEIVGNGSPAVQQAWALYVLPLLKCGVGEERRPIESRPICNNGPLPLTAEIIDDLCAVGHDGTPRLTRALAFEVGVHFPIAVRCDCPLGDGKSGGMAAFNIAWMTPLRTEVARRFAGQGSSGGMVNLDAVFVDANAIQDPAFAGF